MNHIDQARRELAGRKCRQAMMQAVNAELRRPLPRTAERMAAELEEGGCQVEAALLGELLAASEGFERHQLERNAAEIQRLRAIVDQAQEKLN
jgi:hypothetical protein